MPKATANIVSVSPYHNLPAGDLADQLGSVKAEIAALEDREKSLRDELIRRGGADIEGAVYRATISDAVRWTLDAKGVKAEMGDAWWNERCRQSLVTSVAVKALVAAQKLAA